MATDDIDVLVEEEPPKVDPDAIGDPAVPKAEPAAITKPEDGVAVLKQQLAASQAEAAAERARAQAASQETVRAKTETQQTNAQLLETAVGTIKQSIEMTKGQLAEAYATQDFVTVANLQAELAMASARQITLENGLENLKKAPPPRPSVPADPIEALASALTPKSAAWIRSHPQFVRGSEPDKRLVSAHNDALAWDIKVDSPEYFSHIESRLGLTKAATPQPEPDTALSDTAVAAGGRGATPPPAAPTRNSPAGSRVVRLTPEQVEAAAMSGQTPQQYAKELERLRAEKRIN